jgi:hypothetical protein
VPAAPWVSQTAHLNGALAAGAAASGHSSRFCSSSSSSSSSTHQEGHKHEQQHHQQQYESDYGYYEDEPEQPLDKQQVLRELLRKAHAAEVCSVVWCGGVYFTAFPLSILTCMLQALYNSCEPLHSRC